MLATPANAEISYPAKAYSKLDTFEALNLEDADKLFNKKDYKGALAAYNAYSQEFEQSPALAYVLLRMGRCLHHLGKRFAAVKAYQDVIDYFPDDVAYAAGALYHMGEAHGQNGDVAKQTAVWARMVKDDDYVAQPNSGTALAFLGKAMEKLGKHDEAVEYHWRTAVAFRTSNHNAARTARDAVVFHYGHRKPDHTKLKQFYTECGGWDGRAHKVEKPEDDARYWGYVVDTALRHGEGEKKKAVCMYWAGKIGDKFVKDDGMRFKVFDMKLHVDKDREAWVARIMKQYKEGQASLDRLMRWCEHLYRNRQEKPVRKFYADNHKALLAGIDFNKQLWLMEKLRWMKMDDETQVILRSIKTGGMKDPDIARLANFVSHYDGEDGFLGYVNRIKDKMYATKVRFDFYKARSHRNKPYMEKALAEVPALKKDPKYAAGMDWASGELLQGLARYDEAIRAYNAANKQPDSTWRVIDCMIALKSYGPAVQQARGLESVGGGTAAQAALKIADIFRISGDKGKEVGQLRIVLKRYPKSRQSSDAHNRLESYGVALSGGEAEAEE